MSPPAPSAPQISPNPRHRAPDSPLIKIECRVTEKDIEEMLDRFDSGMADLSTSSAVVIALRRLTGGVLGISMRKAAGSSWVLQVEKTPIPVPEEVDRWMQGWSEGRLGTPFCFTLSLPVKAAVPSVRAQAVAVPPMELSKTTEEHVA